MWIDTVIYKEDLENIISDKNIPWEKLDGKSILITGTTGLIGSSIVNALLYYSINCKQPPIIYASVRNIEKAHRLFDQQESLFKENFYYVLGDIEEINDFPEKIDFIIHCASQTSSRAFVLQPAETLETALHGTEKMLKLAKDRNVEGMIYLSSMEVYGSSKKGAYITELDVSAFDPMITRNCYPISKISCESLCNSFLQEYGVPVKIVRLTQTFGPGVEWNDSRVFAEFMRSALEGKDIVLKTKGETERCYLYTADAVRAILTVLIKGKNGEAYNAANEETYCSISQMAEMVCESLSDGKSHVVYEIQNTTKFGYAGTLYMRLDTSKIRSLGWTPSIGLADIYQRMAISMIYELQKTKMRNE